MEVGNELIILLNDPEILQELVYRGLYLLAVQLYLFLPTTHQKIEGL